MTDEKQVADFYRLRLEVLNACFISLLDQLEEMDAPYWKEWVQAQAVKFHLTSLMHTVESERNPTVSYKFSNDQIDFMASLLNFWLAKRGMAVDIANTIEPPAS